MSTLSKSKRSSGSRRLDPRRPFDPKILKRAAAIVAEYQLVMWQEDGAWYGRGVELPNVMNDGQTPDECAQAMRDILKMHVAVMLEDGLSPPPPASAKLRTEQVNLRVTAEEKLALETAATQGGFGGVSDFVRTTALAATAR
jgi:predicted RNase H-like HicB family nuclease